MKISVAMCTYNGERFLKEQIISILSQSIFPDEIIICDDNSQDSTVEIIKSFQKEIGNIKLHINKPSLKTVKNFEKAISLCSGNWIFLCDQDDIWIKDKIKSMIDFATKNDALCVFTNGNLINERNKNLGIKLWDHFKFDVKARKRWENNNTAFWDLLHYTNFCTGATMLLKSELRNYALPIVTPKNFYHDAWFALHAAAHNKLFFMNDNLTSYRIHENQQVGLNNNNENNDSNKDLIKYEDFIKNISHTYPLLFIKCRLNNIVNKLF